MFALAIASSPVSSPAATLDMSVRHTVATFRLEPVPDTLEDATKRIALGWLAQVDTAKYAATWDEASTSLQAAVSKEQWISGLAQVHAQTGPLGARTVTQYQYSTSLPGAPPGEYVVLQYHTVAGSGFVTETVALRHDGVRGWRVAGYFVKPG